MKKFIVIALLSLSVFNAHSYRVDSYLGLGCGALLLSGALGCATYAAQECRKGKWNSVTNNPEKKDKNRENIITFALTSGICALLGYALIKESIFTDWQILQRCLARARFKEAFEKFWLEADTLGLPAGSDERGNFLLPKILPFLKDVC